jgi:hypothetical protein
MMLIAMQLLFAPLAASIAGISVWALHRRETMEDGALVRSFVFLLMLAGIGLYATISSDSVRRRIDPPFRIDGEIDTHPLYETFQRTSPDQAKQLKQLLTEDMAQGATLTEAMLRARAWLTAAGHDRIGFTDQATRVHWGRVTVDSLQELSTRDPVSCQRLIAGQDIDPRVLQQAFSEENTKAFHIALIAVYEAASKGMRHELPYEPPADFNATALEFRAIKEELAHQFGADMASRISSQDPQNLADADPQDLCEARMAQLEAMLTRPKATAALLIDSALR